ncbi:hypothetical protein M2271_005266 [Streptomyces sp. LBL]|nr:hypothetical protein [Streptomyces sp. LBL]MDH6627440.1 hypothetical protein [Streptomyces sp. LBL]
MLAPNRSGGERAPGEVLGVRFTFRNAVDGGAVAELTLRREHP